MMVYAGRYNSGLGFIKVQSDLMFAFKGPNILLPKTTDGERKKNSSRGKGELNTALKL